MINAYTYCLYIAGLQRTSESVRFRFPGTTTYRAVNSRYKANEPHNLPIGNNRYMNVFVRSRNPFEARQALGSRANPAIDCKSIKAAHANAVSGVYWLTRGTPYRVFCEMSISGGGWTHIMSVWDNNNADWRYYNARWTNAATINPQLMGDVHTAMMNRKMGSYMDQPFREFLATNENGKFHHGHNCIGQNVRFPSFRSMIQNGNRWKWFNKRNSSNHQMWNYPNWAFNVSCLLLFFRISLSACCRPPPSASLTPPHPPPALLSPER